MSIKFEVNQFLEMQTEIYSHVQWLERQITSWETESAEILKLNQQLSDKLNSLKKEKDDLESRLHVLMETSLDINNRNAELETEISRLKQGKNSMPIAPDNWQSEVGK